MNSSKPANLIKLTILPEQVGERIDKIISSLPEVSSRNRAIQLIEQGLVTLNSKTVKPSAKVKAGTFFEVTIPSEVKETDLTPFDLNLDILYEDKDVIVINKPAGLVVHPSAGHKEKTLVNALIRHTPDLSMGFNEARPGIVHRLDKDTSGLLVVCKNNAAHEKLALQFKNRTVHRIYWAIVFGHPRFQTRRIENLLGRDPRSRKKFSSVKSNGKKAITNATTLKSSSSGLSLIQLKLDTGRTHQIRVHLSELGHPIVGDVLYGAKRRIAGIHNPSIRKEISALNRIGLLAKELGFTHPSTNEVLSFSVSWPKDLEEIVRLCEF